MVSEVGRYFRSIYNNIPVSTWDGSIISYMDIVVWAGVITYLVSSRIVQRADSSKFRGSAAAGRRLRGIKAAAQEKAVILEADPQTAGTEQYLSQIHKQILDLLVPL